MSDQRFLRQSFLGAAELGLSAVTMAEERTSNDIDMRGATQLALFVALTNGGTATRIDVSVDVSWDDPTIASPVWTPLQNATVGASSTSLADGPFQHTVSGNDEWQVFVTNLNCCMARVRVSTGAGGASASDVVTIRAIRAY